MTTAHLAACNKMRRLAARARAAKALSASPGLVRIPECTPTSHDVLKRNPAAWSMLPFVGLQDTFDGRGTTLEMRNCACGSTLCKTVRRAIEVVR